MRTSKGLVLLALIFVLCFISVSTASAFDGGTGIEGDPYLISTTQQLDNVRNDLTAHYKLLNDIDLTGVDWTPIGTTLDYFNGVFDGNNKTISNLTINGDLSYQGLFNRIDGVVENLYIDNANLTVGRYAGVLAGRFLSNALIENVHVSGSITSSSADVGGLTDMSYGIIRNCSANVDIETAINSYAAGGLVGSNQNLIENSFASGNITRSGASNGKTGGLAGHNNGIINQSYATGNVTIIGGTASSTYSGAGGLVGHNHTSGQIYNCFGLGDVITDTLQKGGGLVGVNYGNISKSYSIGEVHTPTVFGGLVGYENEPDNVTFSYWDIATSQQTDSASGEGKSHEDMKKQDTFNTWDFADIWNIQEDITYPYLRMLLIPDIPDFDYTPVTGINLSESEITLEVDENVLLGFEIEPINASIQAVIWSSTDDEVATVDQNGLVMGISGGTAIITATTVDGDFEASCTVNVTGFPPVLSVDRSIEGLAYSQHPIDRYSDKNKIVISGTVANLTPDQSITVSAELIKQGDENGIVTSQEYTAIDTEVVFELTFTIDNSITEGSYNIKVTVT